MDVAVKKLELIDWLMHLKDEAKLERLLNIKAEMDESIVAYNAVGEPMDINQYKAKIEKGVQDWKEGRFMSGDDLAKEIKNW
jgi:predicted transcriptional regulator